MLSKPALLYYTLNCIFGLTGNQYESHSLTVTIFVEYASCLPCEFGWNFSCQGFDTH